MRDKGKTIRGAILKIVGDESIHYGLIHGKIESMLGTKVNIFSVSGELSKLVIDGTLKRKGGGVYVKR